MLRTTPATRSDPAAGLIAGIFLGATSGLWVWTSFLPGSLLFPGDTIVVGAVVGALLGDFLGDDFFRRVRDRWLR